MKILLAFMVLFFSGTISAAEAQQRGWSGTMPGVQQLIVEYGDELNLTDTQKAELIEKSIEQRERLRGVRQRGNVRGERRGTGTIRQRSPERRNTERGERSWSRADLIRDVLTEEQFVTLQTLRIEKAEKQHEYRTLRHQMMVQEAGISGNKAEEVLTLLNGISEHHKAVQVQRIQHPGEWDRNEAREAMNRVRDTHNEIKNLLTAAEYESLQRTMRSGGAFQQGRMGSRPVMRSR
jgi:hypothetical protein